MIFDMTTSSLLQHWVIFCRVVDNHGDLGVCWRLASQLANKGKQVTLYVDDASALAWMAPVGCEGVKVLAWPTEAGAYNSPVPPDVVIEAFGCALPLHVQAALAGQTKPPVWINLEYFSAEAVSVRNHGLPSPIMSGPAKGWTKTFFYPGFTPETGGLLREADRRLVEQLQPDVVLIVLDEDGWRGGALDSLSRVLQPLRDDSVHIAIALRVARGVVAPDDAERQAAVERVLRRIRPDVIFPGLVDPLPSILGSTPQSSYWWRALMLRSAATVKRVRPRTLIGWSASRLDATDSAVYAWASAPTSPVSLLGAVSFPSFSGLPAVDARLRAFDRWHQRAVAGGGGAQPHWLVTVGGLPHAHGDAAQLAAIRHALAWGSRRAWIQAAVIGEPADYEGGVGLRAANGRLRSSVPALSLAARQMRDVRPGSPP